jgi:hypothetical protein
LKSDRGICHILADATALASIRGAVALFGVLQVAVVAQHGFLAYESIKAAKRFAHYGWEVI